MNDYLTDDDITATGTTELNRPDYIGVVSGAQYKLDNADGVSEYALVVIEANEAFVYEASSDDLRFLAKQIRGLLE